MNSFCILKKIMLLLIFLTSISCSNLKKNNTTTLDLKGEKLSDIADRLGGTPLAIVFSDQGPDIFYFRFKNGKPYYGNKKELAQDHSVYETNYEKSVCVIKMYIKPNDKSLIVESFKTFGSSCSKLF